MSFKQRENMLLRQIAGQWILLPVGEDVVNLAKIITLNDLGAFLWRKIGEGHCTCDALTGAVLAEYDIDSATARHDIDAFVHDMKQKGLII